MSLGRIRERIFSQSLVSGALDISQDLIEPGIILGVYLTASVNITETITITRKSRNGSTYDHVIKSGTLNAERYFRYSPDSEKIVLLPGDSVEVQCTNANTTGIIYGTLLLEGGINNV